ncbi:MAG: Imm27 family immunity protein [Cyclobacteriaceae bacterium]
MYKDPNDHRFWELIYEDSGSHGGGPPTLIYLRDDEPRKNMNCKAADFHLTQVLQNLLNL